MQQKKNGPSLQRAVPGRRPEKLERTICQLTRCDWPGKIARQSPIGSGDPFVKSNTNRNFDLPPKQQKHLPSNLSVRRTSSAASASRSHLSVFLFFLAVARKSRLENAPKLTTVLPHRKQKPLHRIMSKTRASWSCTYRRMTKMMRERKRSRERESSRLLRRRPRPSGPRRQHLRISSRRGARGSSGNLLAAPVTAMNMTTSTTQWVWRP